MMNHLQKSKPTNIHITYEYWVHLVFLISYIHQINLRYHEFWQFSFSLEHVPEGVLTAAITTLCALILSLSSLTRVTLKTSSRCCKFSIFWLNFKKNYPSLVITWYNHKAFYMKTGTLSNNFSISRKNLLDPIGSLYIGKCPDVCMCVCMYVPKASNMTPDQARSTQSFLDQPRSNWINQSGPKWTKVNPSQPKWTQVNPSQPKLTQVNQSQPIQVNLGKFR